MAETSRPEFPKRRFCIIASIFMIFELTVQRSAEFNHGNNNDDKIINNGDGSWIFDRVDAEVAAEAQSLNNYVWSAYWDLKKNCINL